MRWLAAYNRDRSYRRQVKLFTRDLIEAVASAFDRESGARVPPEALKTCAEALASYHTHPETKFHNGKPLDRGRTHRCHVRVIGIRLIGKESNDWERQAELGFDDHVQPEYGATGNLNAQSSKVERRRMERASEQSTLNSMVAERGLRETARGPGVDPSNLRRKILRGGDGVCKFDAFSSSLDCNQKAVG